MADDMQAPEAAYYHIADYSSQQRTNQTAKVERLPDQRHAVREILDTELERFTIRGSAQYPGSYSIGEIEYGRHGDRIGDPDQRNRNWQIDSDGNCRSGCHHHLHGHGYERPEETDGESSRDRSAVHVPEIGVVQQISEYPQMLMIANHFVTGCKFFDQMLRHGYFNRGSNLSYQLN